ncbi:hypothetical protein ACFLXX_05840 [Chloroflexota bacterium]
MSKGPKIKDWVRAYICEEALRNRDKPRDLVAQKIEDYLGDKEAVPSRDTLNKLISQTRNSDEPEDNYWTLSALPEYELQPEALSSVMQAWALSIKQEKPLTIRQARWIARLYHLLNEQGLEFLVECAIEYALHEKIMKLTTKYPRTLQGMAHLWFEDASLNLVLTGDNSLSQHLNTLTKWEPIKDITKWEESIREENIL